MLKRIVFGFVLLILISNSQSQITSLDQYQTLEPTVVFLGASNSVEAIETVPRNGSYVTELRNSYDTWVNVNIIDSSVSGATVTDYFGNGEKVNEMVSNYNPNYVVIILGGNDFLGFVNSFDF